MAIFSAIAYAFAYAGSFLAAAAGIPFATAVQVGMIAGQVGSAIAALAIQKALTPDVNIPQQEIQAVINQTDAPRRISPVEGATIRSSPARPSRGISRFQREKTRRAEAEKST